jgi:hypothetical protein
LKILFADKKVYTSGTTILATIMSEYMELKDDQLPEDFELLVQYIKDKLQCPLPIKENERYYPLRYKMVGLWRKIAKEFSVDREWYYIHEEDDEQDFELREELITELQPIAININYWINEARKKFLDMTKPIQCIVADEKVYAKHLLRKPTSTEKIIKLCLRTKTSFLFAEITGQMIQDILLYAGEQYFEGIVYKRNLRISALCNRLVGVTDRGEITKYLLIDIDGDNAIAHAYPCSYFEATNNIKEYEIRERDKFDYFYLNDDDENDENELRKSIKFTTLYLFQE